MPRKNVSCEAILQHIGRVHFNERKYFAYHVHFPNGATYKIRYNWVKKESDYLHFHPELAGLECDFSASPHHLIGKIECGVTIPRIFFAKPMISVMRCKLTRWEQSGYGRKGRKLKQVYMVRNDAVVDMCGITDEERAAVAAREGLVRLEYASASTSRKLRAKDWEYFGYYCYTPVQAKWWSVMRTRHWSP